MPIRPFLMTFLTCQILLLGFSSSLPAQQADQDGNAENAPDAHKLEFMTPERMLEILLAIDENTEISANSAVFMLGDQRLMLVYDETADRMRIMTPIASTSVLTDKLAVRMLQANYDAVLDVRYAIANELIWSAFIHPLTPLSDEEFVSAVAQTATAAKTFGLTFSSGALVFGGGDSSGIHRDLFEEIEKRLRERGI